MRRLLRAAVLLLAAGCVRAAPLPPLSGNLEPLGREPLELSLPRYGADAGTFDLSAERGHVVLLDVWATWCEPCAQALPLYEDLQKEYRARGLRVFAVNVDEDESDLPAFLARHGVHLPVVRDANGEVAERLLKVRVMPTALLLDRSGVVRHVHEGFAESFLPMYQRELEALLAEGDGAGK